MAQLKLFDSTGDQSTTTGTGTLTGAVGTPTGYQTPSSGGVADADNTIIRIESTDGTVWEVCETVYTVSGTTWSRGTLIGSSTGSRISFASGTKNIYCVSPKEMMSGSIMTTTGDMLYRNTTKPARLAIGTTGQVLSTDGTSPVWTTIIGGGIKVYSNTAVPGGNTIANTGSDTAFNSSYTVPANTLSAGDVVRLKLWGIYSTALTPPTITVKVKIGGTTVLNTGAITTVGNVSSAGFFMDIDLSFFTIGASGTCDAQAYGEYATALTTGLSINVPNSSTTTIDTTVDELIQVTITWGTASASNTITCRQFDALLLKAQGTGTPVAVAQGGTGLTTLTNHALQVGAATSNVTQLATGTAAQILTSGGSGADPAWITAVPIANGGTNLTGYTTGDLPYASATNVLSKLAIGATGSSLTVFGGVPIWTDFRFAITGSDFTTTSTTLVDVTGMGFSIAANEVWAFELNVYGSTTNTAPIQFAVNAPSGATGIGIQQKFLTGSFTNGSVTTINTAFASVATNVATTLYRLTFSVINSSNAGTVQIRIQAASAGTADVPVGSYIIAHRVL